MPFAVTCPDCTTKLRSASPMKVGNKITCPKCQFAFRIEFGDSVEEVAAPDAKAVGQYDFDPEPIPAAPVKKAPRPAPAERPPQKPTAAEPPPRPARRAAPPPEADEDDGDDAPDRPKKKKPQKASNVLFMLSLLVVSAVLIGGIVYVFLEFANAPADKDLLVYAPTGTETIFGIAVEEIAGQDKLLAFLKKSVGKNSPILD